MEGTSANTITDIADVDSSNEAVMEYLPGVHLAAGWLIEDCCALYTWYLGMVFYTYKVMSRLLVYKGVLALNLFCRFILLNVVNE